MITVSLIQPADVAALNCVYFNLTKELKEILWYGLDCNLNSRLSDLDLGLTYLQILQTGCTLDYSMQCEIKNFISKLSSYCVTSQESCDRSTVITTYSYLTTEDGDILTTESGDLILA